MKSVVHLLITASIFVTLACGGGETTSGDPTEAEVALLSPLPQTLTFSLNGFSGAYYQYVLDTTAWSLYGLTRHWLEGEAHSFLVATPQPLPDTHRQELEEALAHLQLVTLSESACEKVKSDPTVIDGDFPTLTIGSFADGVRYQTYPLACLKVRGDDMMNVYDIFEVVDQVFSVLEPKPADEEAFSALDKSIRGCSGGLCRAG